jgi:hypothetical protein
MLGKISSDMNHCSLRCRRCGDNVFWKNCQHPAVPIATPIGSSVHRYDQVKLRQNHHKLPSGSVAAYSRYSCPLTVKWWICQPYPYS